MARTRGESGRLAASRQSEIVRTVREWIVGGRYGPGRQLPPHTELARQFDAGTVTIQLALKRLAHEGFVEGRRPLGTFVVDEPSHLTRYGLVFCVDPQGPLARLEWSRYHQAVTQAAVGFERETGRRMLQFHGLGHHADGPDRRRLIEQVETQRLAGLIFANPPLFLEGSPILDAPGMPRVAIQIESSRPEVLTVRLDTRAWFDRALDYLAGLGRRRVGVIAFAMWDPSEAALRERLAARGMQMLPRWMQFASTQNPQGARHAAELLMNDRERPDGLLIQDDNFVEQVQAGLAAAGVRVPEDVAVVGHANYPAPPARTLPIRLLGYDLGAALDACVSVIDACRRGETPPEVTNVPAVWDDELQPRDATAVPRTIRAHRPSGAAPVSGAR